ncbi:unnamed protein product [Colias eurytheme]|nr:unnamed protein product [Colias eurytheme]
MTDELFSGSLYFGNVRDGRARRGVPVRVDGAARAGSISSVKRLAEVASRTYDASSNGRLRGAFRTLPRILLLHIADKFSSAEKCRSKF